MSGKLITDLGIMLGFTAAVLLLVSVWVETQSVSVIVSAFFGMMSMFSAGLLLGGRFLEQTRNEPESREIASVYPWEK